MTLSYAALLRPRSVALIGVSDDPSKTAGRPLQFLRRAGFKGEIFVVNPRRETVQGEGAFKSLADLPKRPDHAFILTDAEKALDALEECQRLGVPVATMLSSGFAEVGERGSANQVRLEAILARGNIRLVGPSSIGVVNLHNGLTLTANAAFAEPDLPKGGIFVGSHSGSLIGALVSRGKRKGIGFAGLVSVGAETDLSIGEICMATLDDPQITSYMLFIETLRHADKLQQFALEAARRGKPVAAFKLGRSEEAAELAVSHTGSLAGADEVADIFLAELGIARVESFEGLLEVMPLLQQVPASETGPRKGRVGVVTTTGGGAAMAVDQLALRGVEVVPASEETRARLREKGIEPGEGRIIDLTLAGTRYDVMKATLDILRAAPEFDLVLATAGSSARFNPELVVKPAVDAAREPGHPLAVFLVPDAPDAARLLTKAGVPAFQDPETCGDAIAAALHRRDPTRSGLLDNVSVNGEAEVLDEAACYRMLDRHGLTSAAHVVLKAGEPVPELPFEYPVVAKVLHSAIPHKTDAGGVVLNIADTAQLADAMRAIVSRVAKSTGIEVSEILVQQMARGVGEVLVGFRRDPQVGPLIVLAAGGIFTELYRDSTMRLAPVDRAAALEMIGEIRASRILDGYRGGTKGDLDALADAIVSVSRLATETSPRVEEFEINPLLVLPQGQGVRAIDGFARVTR